MLTKDDLFTSVSKTAVNLQQDSVPKEERPKTSEKRPYKKNRAAKRVPSQVERYRIGKLLEEHLTPRDEEGLVVYLNGMDDDKIAEIIGPTVSRDSVRHMRQEVFGVLRKVSPPGLKADDLAVRLTNLEGIVTYAVERIVRLEKLFDQLAEEIGSSFRTWTDRL